MAGIILTVGSIVSTVGANIITAERNVNTIGANVITTGGNVISGNDIPIVSPTPGYISKNGPLSSLEPKRNSKSLGSDVTELCRKKKKKKKTGLL